MLTVAVSVSSGVQNVKSALPFMQGHETEYAVLLVILLAALNLRGVRESGAFFAIPTYGFMVGVIGMAIYGAVPAFGGNLPQVESADLKLAPDPSYAGNITQVALIFLLARAFSSGCAALTGVEAISNGVPAFRKPKSENAATTLLLLGDDRGHDAAQHHHPGPPDGPEVRRPDRPRTGSPTPTASRSRAATSSTR